MKTIKTIFVILLTATLLGCGGGGGSSGGGQNPSSSSMIYTVSTLFLNSLLITPSGVTVDAQGVLYVADTGVNWIQKVQNSGNGSYSVSRLLGYSGVGVGGSYSGCNSNLLSPYGVAVDSAGILYVSELRPDIRYSDCVLNTSYQFGTLGLLSNPSGVALHADIYLYVVDTGNHVIRLITKSGGSGTTELVAGTSTASGYVNGASNIAAFSSPTGIAVSRSGDVYVTDTNNCVIRKISAGRVSTLAGAGPSSCGSADGTATSAQFNRPTGIALDASDNLYVADTVSNKIRRITPQGVVTTIAGSGVSGSADGTGSSATFNTPTGIAVDTVGNLFVSEYATGKIRKITVTP
jgi:sugar lactone lactonase YvrE